MYLVTNETAIATYGVNGSAVVDRLALIVNLRAHLDEFDG